MFEHQVESLHRRATQRRFSLPIQSDVLLKGAFLPRCSGGIGRVRVALPKRTAISAVVTPRLSPMRGLVEIFR